WASRPASARPGKGLPGALTEGWTSEDLAFAHHVDDPIDALVHVQLMGGQDQVGGTGFLVGEGDAGHIAAAGHVLLGRVEAAGVALPAYVQWRVQPDEDAVLLADHRQGMVARIGTGGY